LIPAITQKADEIISKSNLFISIGTSGVVWPAAGFPQIAKSNGATLIEINPEPSEQSDLYDHVFRGRANDMLNTILGKSN
jgi:NAD-dependent deacetylase